MPPAPPVDGFVERDAGPWVEDKLKVLWCYLHGFAIAWVPVRVQPGETESYRVMTGSRSGRRLPPTLKSNVTHAASRHPPRQGRQPGH
jgi:hypothetical protein